MSKFSKPKPDKPAKTKPRKCLMCRETFVSEGPHHRICQKCKGSQAYRDGLSPYSH